MAPQGAAVAPADEAARQVVIVEYSDLVKGEDLCDQLVEAWGPDGIGIIAIRGIPKWTDLYSAVLRQSHSLAHLPSRSLEALEDPGSMYNAGWSHGKEKLGDKPDLAKGSFYFNPLADEPGTAEDREKFPWALPRNRWPTEELPELEAACKALGDTMHRAVAHLARLVDRFMDKQLDGKHTEMGPLIESTMKCKGRLLYYFPPKGSHAVEATELGVAEDGWIGWHNDSGFLTALTPDIYVDDETGEVLDNPDPEAAGLWVVTRDGSSVHVPLRRDCMFVQVGECVQVLSGGLLVATPHCVRGCRPSATRERQVARVSCPCFIDTHPSFELAAPTGRGREEILASSVSTKVPPLAERWLGDEQTFGDFLGKSFLKYYSWAAGNKGS